MNTKLMVVDDEKNIRETIRDYFEDCGWSVRTFSSAEDALDFLVNESSEYIIVDGRLPGMTGTEFIQKACRIKSGIKYLIFTGSNDFSIDNDLRELGISEKNIVIKPAMGFHILQNALENLNNTENTED
jgi:DNA-binding NtrC family response regulator